MKQASHRSTNTALFHLHEVYKIVMKAENRWRLPGAGEKEKWRVANLSMGVQFQLCKVNEFMSVAPHLCL